MTANSAFVMIAGYIPTLDGSLRPEVPARMIELFPVEMETIESALTELEEIKKRLIDKSLELQKGLGELDDPRMSKETKSFYRAIAMAKIGVIDYIIKGEGK